MADLSESNKLGNAQGCVRCRLQQVCGWAPIFANEQRVVLAYYINTTDPSWDGKAVRILNQERSDEPIALVRLDCFAHMFGPPNDEAFSGHPLASRGLHPYGAFRIERSSWIRKLERMNRVHDHHRPECFERFHHLVFTFMIQRSSAYVEILTLEPSTDRCWM